MVELTQRPVGRNFRNLVATRKGTILVAAACALAAAGIIIYALSKYRQSVDSGNRPETVFVASGLIQKGTPGSVIAANQLSKPTTIVAKQVTPGAIADAALLNGRVAATDIYPGQQITLSDFVPGVGVAATLSPKQRAVEVPIQAAPGLAGDLTAGDYVDVYVSLTGGNGQAAVLRLLAANVRVLVAPGGGGGGLGANQQAGNLTLAVDNSLAPKVMFASDNGKLWLSLRPGNAVNPNPDQAATLNSIAVGPAPVESSATK
jgi:pilus assembly protein CpaB